MSTVDLIFKKPKNAYELVRFIQKRQVSRVLKISTPAIFKSCRRLADNGYLVGKTVHEPGVPNKVIYQINEKGRERFYELMFYFSKNIKPYFLEFNTVLWNIETLEPKKAYALLLELQNQLKVFQSGVIIHEKKMGNYIPFGPRQIIKQYRMTITTLVKWIEDVVKEFEETHSTVEF